MTGRTRIGACLAVLASTVLAACGGNGHVMRVTLSDSGCTFEGDRSPEAGRFAVELENATFRFGSFGVIALFGGEAIDDIELGAERVRSRLLQRSRARSDVPPPFGRWVVGADVEPSGRTSLPVDVAAGRYAVLCYVHRNTDERRSSGEIPRPATSFVAGELEVEGTRTYP